jgi:hypothetical protein
VYTVASGWLRAQSTNRHVCAAINILTYNTKSCEAYRLAFLCQHESTSVETASLLLHIADDDEFGPGRQRIAICSTGGRQLLSWSSFTVLQRNHESWCQDDAAGSVKTRWACDASRRIRQTGLTAQRPVRDQITHLPELPVLRIPASAARGREHETHSMRQPSRQNLLNLGCVGERVSTLQRLSVRCKKLLRASGFAANHGVASNAGASAAKIQTRAAWLLHQWRGALSV